MSMYPLSPPSSRRQPSTASNASSYASSNYSYPSSRSTTITSASSNSSRFSLLDAKGGVGVGVVAGTGTETGLVHKHTQSLGMSPLVSSYTSTTVPSTPPRKTPTGTPNITPTVTPTKNTSPYSLHIRGNSYPVQSPTPSPYTTALSTPSQKRPVPAPTPFSNHRHSVISGTSSLQASDIESLRNSSVSHFRTLSRLTREGAADDFSIDSGQDVAGMHGRKRLQRVATDHLSSWERLNWMDKRRQYIQAYEYLCHIGEAKEWMEECIGEAIPPIVELEEALRDGVTLAKLVRVFAPELVPRIFDAKKLQFRHSDNIDRFFRFLRKVELPDIFIFGLTDIYEKKNIPKVIYCIHALSFLLFRLGLTNNTIGNLVGKLEFTEAEIQNTQRGLDIAGVSLPSFRGVNKHFGHEPEPEPEPEETEEDRIHRELGEAEDEIHELQNLCRGALVRLRLGRQMEGLWDSEDFIIELQAMIRGMFARTTYAYKADMASWAKELQALARGFLVREAFLRQSRHFTSNERLIVRLQSRYRGNQVRAECRAQMAKLERAATGIVGLQAAARALLLRKELEVQMQDVYENEDFVVELQARAKGALLRMSLTTTIEDVHENEDFIAELQARARGALLRMSLAATVEDVFETQEEIVELQSVARAVLVRRKLEQKIRDLVAEEDNIKSLQSVIRGGLLRKRFQKDAEALEDADDAFTKLAAGARAVLVRKAIQRDMEALHKAKEEVILLQSAIRGALVRTGIEIDMEKLQAEDDTLPYLQAAARGYLLRRKFDTDNEQLEANTELWEELQAAARGYLVRQEYQQKIIDLNEATEEIIELQACARGVLARWIRQDLLENLEAAVDSIIPLQAHCRGFISQNAYYDTLDALDREVKNIINIQSYIRGFLFRQQQQQFMEELDSEMRSVVLTQAAIRGALVRLHMDDLVLAIQDEEESIIELQAAAKAMLERTRFQGRLKHFKDNMEKVVKIQSFVRAKQQGEAYKSLMSGKNPPVGTVKNFVHLLNDSDFDFDEEIEFERLRKNVVQHVRANELAENYVDQLDIKIALLVKNKITLDEVIRHQKRFTGHVGNLLSNTEIASSDPFDLKALNNNSRKRLERYQQLFFALQTQPQYLARLFKRIREQNTADKELKRIENLMMGLFGYAQKRREEYYLLKLISKSIKEEVERCERPEDYLRGNFFWVKLAGNYIRSPRDRKYLKDLLGPMIREDIIENDELDLESDPMQIYKSSINNEELRTGMRSQRDPDVPRDQAIRDPETRGTFINHLQSLRNLTDDFIAALEDQLARMPYGIRYIAQQSFEALIEKFPYEGQDAMLQVVEHWVYQKYMNPAVVGPDTFGIVEKNLAPMQKKNLGELGKMLNQISSGRLFTQDNVYLQPLNEYVSVAVGRMMDVFRIIIDVPNAETRFEIDEFEDLTSKQKPTLYIKMSDIFAIHRLIAQDVEVVAPSKEDQLRVIIGELGSVQTSEAELKNVANTEIGLQLDPHFQRIEDPDSEVKALFVETKRSILYVIRIQTGANLMEILVKPITREDEEKWQQLLGEEQSGKKRGAYADATTLSDVSMMTYTELKRTALENIIGLERTGKITRKNHYQDLLNAIATDIRTKHRRRVQRNREVDGVKQTLAHLHEKAVYLEGQLQSYNDYIEQAMVTLQTKKGKKKVILPFTRQYFHMRELQRSGRVPKFGSYKYTARGLAEKGVLVKLEGWPEKKWDKISFTVSSDEVGVFFVEASNGSMMIPGAATQVLLDDLLQMQFHNNQFMMLCDGMIKFNVNLFLHLLFRKFYRDE